MKKTLSLLTGVFLSLTGAAAWSATGEAIIHGTEEGSTIQGTVKLEDTKKGLKIVAMLSGVPTGNHGFHIHQLGSCANAGKAAGGHYNPKGKMHGSAAKDGLGKAHAGDLGNITIGSDGQGKTEVEIRGVWLNKGNTRVAGRAIILHAKPDDFGQPTGNAGGRIGCGPIVLTKE